VGDPLRDVGIRGIKAKHVQRQYRHGRLVPMRDRDCRSPQFAVRDLECTDAALDILESQKSEVRGLVVR